MKHMQQLMNKIDRVVNEPTQENVNQLIEELDNYRDITILKSQLRRKGVMTPELEQLFDGVV